MRVLLVCVVLGGFIFSATGCAVLARGASQIPPVHLPPGVGSEVAEEIARTLERRAAAREAAAVALGEAGLDFACTYGNAGDALDPAVEFLRDEVRRRVVESSRFVELGDVHDGYEQALEDMERLGGELAFAAGTVAIATWCKADEAAN